MAFLSGLAAAVVLIPINKVITNNIGRMSEKMMTAKDHRVKVGLLFRFSAFLATFELR